MKKFNQFNVCSASDLPEQILYDSWSIKHQDSDIYNLIIKEYLVKASHWAQKKSIEFSKIQSVLNILKSTNGTESKQEFCVRLIYYFGYALNANYQNEFAIKVNKML